ncbi:hypothetical protein C9374_002504 [Naegleria lovaniensis]|uniref:Fanconi anemia group D2 protein n=1 Tax=Naegleria lovaniensis TaxID=51637 RepID=A0AA88GTT0_NAELO|nr:uncharacterized protein C9374_002504 [Naegleria lovaniensis]KAG2386760.1 hypothetical protein C9374_002504 [Naegleria lovaniensis]
MPSPPQRGFSGSSSSQQPNVSQHLKKFYNLLRDGGLIGLPPYEKVQFTSITIKANTSGNSYSKKNRSGSSSSSANSSSPFESIKALKVKDAMDLRRHIEKEVARTSKREVENFCFALESMIADEYFFSLCLLPFESGEGNASFSSNESFFKMLLNISTIQSSIFDVLFKQLLSRCPNYEEDSFEQWDRNLPKLILSQMRWLDMISDPKSLTEHIGTILEVASTDFSKEMITAIPEIIDDSEHDHVVDKLDQVMQDKTEMTSCVIDALSNLNLQKDVMDKTTERVLRNLNSASTDDLPVIIRYLLQSANEENISNVVDGIRKDLDVSSFTIQDDTQDDDEDSTTARKNKGKGSSESRCESLIISAMATGIRHRKIIEKSFIQTISACEEEHTIVDLWILFAIYSMPNYRKDAEQVLKKKIKAKRITSELLKSSIENHGEALEQYFSSLNDLASTLLRNTSDSLISQFAMEMYFCMFCSFKADYNKQKVIQSLITHVGSSSKNEKDLALDILLMIATSKLSLLRNYSSFFQVLLDSLTNLTDGQLRKVYTLFSMLAYTKTLENSTQSGITKSTKDELMIIIRKQLSNTNTVYKKMGVIGVCSVLSMLGSRGSELQALPSQANDQQDLSDEEFEEAKDLWDFALKCCFRTPIFKTILYDEMTFVILEKSLDPKLTAEIKNRLLHDFYQRCTIEKPDLKKQKSQTRNLEYRAQYIVQGNNKEDPNHLINILPLLDNKRDDTHESVWNLFSQFRLMRVLMNKLGEELSDDLVSSGVVLFDHEDMTTNFRDYTKNEKDLVCLSLFFAINWFRELLNGFANDESCNAALLERIETLHFLEKHLDLCLSKHPSFHLPHFNLLTQQEVPTSVSTKKTSSKSKKKQITAEDDDEEDAMEVDEESTSKSTKNTEYSSTPTKRKYLSPLKPHYRELDLKVVHIISKNENCEKKIEPLHLFYILDDLHQKLKSVIARNKVSFFASKEKENMYNLSRITTKEFFSEIFELLPHLYKQIRVISDKSASNDSSQAVDEDDDEEAAKNGDFIVPSFQLLVDIITKTLEYFSSDKTECSKIIDIMFSVDFPNEDNSIEDEDKCTKLFESIRKILDSLKTFESCYKLYELLKSIAFVSNIKGLLKALQGVAEQLLQTPFSHVKSDALGNLIEGYITLPGGLGPLVEALSKKLSDEHFGDNSNVLDQEFPTITKSTMPIIFKRCYLVLGRKLLQHDLTAKSDSKVLTKVCRILLLYKKLTRLTRNATCTPQIMQATLIGAKTFLANFLKLIRYLGKHIKENQEVVLAIFKHLRNANSQLQAICSNRKLSLNKSLAKIIPKVKKDLESCNFKTKAALKLNGIDGAINIQVISEKDVTGNSASSQHYYSQLIVDKKKKGNASDQEEEEEIDDNNREEAEEEEQSKKKRKKSRPLKRRLVTRTKNLKKKKKSSGEKKRKKPTTIFEEENEEEEEDNSKMEQQKKKKKNESTVDENSSTKKSSKASTSSKKSSREQDAFLVDERSSSSADPEQDPTEHSLAPLSPEYPPENRKSKMSDDSLADFIDFENDAEKSNWLSKKKKQRGSEEDDTEDSNHSAFDFTKSLSDEMEEDDFVADDNNEEEEEEVF